MTYSQPYADRVADKFLAHVAAHGGGKSGGTRYGGPYGVWPLYREKLDIPETFGNPRIATDGERIISFGDHFTIAYFGNGGVWLVAERFQTGTWKSGKPKYSPTTDGHMSAVCSALLRHGFVETDRETVGPGNRPYRHWIRPAG